MKGMKGKLLKKLKSVKPIGYLKQDRLLQVNAADGFIETLLKTPSQKAETQLICKEAEQDNAKENRVVNINQEPEIIDVSELMKDLEEEEEMEVDDDEDDDINDKENIGPPPPVKAKENLCQRLNSFGQTPLSEIDISSFRRPDLNSGSLFDPNLLAAFEQAVKEHIRMSVAERQARIELENLERSRKQEEEIKQEGIEEVSLEKYEEEEEPPLKARRIEEGEEEEEENPLLGFPEKCPPAGSDSVIFYTTTLRGIRKTFENCNSIRFLLESFRVIFHERDVSMHMEFKEELWRILDGKAMPPRLFIKGRYIGGAEEVLGLHEQGKLRVLFEGIPIDRSIGPCEACAGVRFVLCFNCCGSHRVIADDGLSSKCQDCNENGLIICPYCC